MSFREFFLNKIAERTTSAVTKNPIDPKRLEAFTRKDLETAVQLYLHLKNMGNTLDDLVAFIEDLRNREQRDRLQSAVRDTIVYTREQRKLMKRGARGKRSRHER